MLIVCFELLDWRCEFMLSFVYKETSWFKKEDKKEGESDETHVRQKEQEEETGGVTPSLPVGPGLAPTQTDPGPLMKI